jgi:hypothetical protein
MTNETILALCQAGLEAAESTKIEKAIDPAFDLSVDDAYESIVGRWDSQDVLAKKRGWRKGLRSDELPQPALGAPGVFRAVYEAALGA